MLGSPAGPGGASQRGLWPLAPSAASFTTDGFGKCGVYSLFPGGPTFGSALYSHASIGRFASGHIQSTGNPFHATHKVSDSLFSSTGYMFGAPTPPPGSPYSPVPVTQLELLTKGFNASSSNIIIQQQPEYPTTTTITTSPKKIQQDNIKRCEDKCNNNNNNINYNNNNSVKNTKNCNCQLGSPIKNNNNNNNSGKFTNPDSSGCSRTNPIEWTNNNNIVKKEPGSNNPCQVAEISTSNLSPIVKLEVTSPRNNVSSEIHIDANMPSIGIAVARQRFQQQEIIGSPSLPPTGLLTTVNAASIKEVARLSEFEPSTGMAASTPQGGLGGGTLLQCNDDRNTSLAAWSMGGAHNSLNTPTLWQYPAPVPMEPMVPLPVPMPPVGFQLVRDPTTGGLLLLPTTTGIEPLQQTVVWPSYHQPPSLLLPPLPPPLQLLSTTTSSDYLSSTNGTNTTLHQTHHHHHHHSTRLLVTTSDNKRKLPQSSSTTLIKIETTEASTTLDHAKITTTNTGCNTVFTAAAAAAAAATTTTTNTTPLLTIYPTNLIIPQDTTTTTMCKSQVTSPVTCLTPPPEINEATTTTVVDAGNQTELMSEDEDEDQFPKETTTTTTNPDLSGLELLSNSIVEYEINRNKINETNLNNDCDDTKFGGLKLLCALAEQRIMEEVKMEEEEEEENEKEEEVDEEMIDNDGNRRHSNNFVSGNSENSDNKCYCDYRSYKTAKSEEEVKKFIASKTLTNCCKNGEWPCMNAMELDMRMKLADLQRQYREKQKELMKLKPKKQEKRKKSLTPPPALPTQTPKLEMKTMAKQELLKPSILCTFEMNKMPKLEAIKQSDRIINDYKKDLLKQQQQQQQQEQQEEKLFSSSKKRKVGRPKKIMSPSGYHTTITETIVAKKPKNNFVGYLLAAKEKLQLQKFYRNKSPRFIEEQQPIKKNEDIKCKIRPKLKAEPTIKLFDEDEEEIDHIDEDLDEEFIEEIEDDDDYEVDGNNDGIKNEVKKNDGEDKVKPQQQQQQQQKQQDTKCTLTAKHLEIDKLRVLTAMGGLFYAGHLNAVEPPDVYSITLDGERGNRPHIMSREEILRDAIVEVSPKNTLELTVGTRLCAYWSQQYRCLYPGSVAEPGTPNPELDSRFVAVEFDDGDSGRIAIEDIRLLPPDYPIIEYDPNPLLSLSKRRRRTSTSVSTEERKPALIDLKQFPPIPSLALHDLDIEKENKDINKPQELIETTSHKERKRLKKKKRDKLKQKLLQQNENLTLKKKKRKHKCLDEYCKHKKHHKKHHRKHKKHHHNVIEEELQNPELPIIKDDYVIMNPEDEVTMDDIEATKIQQQQQEEEEEEQQQQQQKKSKKIRDRQESCESRSKMSAFLPARQLWGWSGKGYKRPRAKGRSRKQFFKAIQRGKETITVGDSAVFLSTGRPDRPYIGRIEAMWELCGTMVVKVKWFYHPEETVGCPLNLQYPGALFESPHIDENDVQTISHKCEVLPLKEYTERLGDDPQRYATIYDNNDIYYLAGYYDPTTTTLKMEPEIPFLKK